MELTIIGIQYRKWKDTQWKGQILPIEIDYSENPNNYKLTKHDLAIVLHRKACLKP